MLYGFLIWLVPFVVAVCIYKVRESNRPLFESIMPVVVAAATVFLANRYHRKRAATDLREWYQVGFIWLLVSLLLDWPMFSYGPMKMTAAEYFSDIGVTYLLIPVIAAGCGHLLRDA